MNMYVKYRFDLINIKHVLKMSTFYRLSRFGCTTWKLAAKLICYCHVFDICLLHLLMYTCFRSHWGNIFVECCHVVDVTFISADEDGPIVVCGGVLFLSQTQINNLLKRLSFLLYKLPDKTNILSFEWVFWAPRRKTGVIQRNVCISRLFPDRRVLRVAHKLSSCVYF